ncbi:hypothetical protein SAMN05192559_10324 [Halobacillus karajensis]|uniref:Lipoprotein n=1 Tax=Halobacillus karajensis TaxID=195088 RepID=A0A024P8Z9_9BACI|nr:hypothetical protein [Halobacillus karajensis]CDQ20034.1 hypothetical protein BN982_02346 [Halobacillus karajensis]CDQ25303.1 hypothetical protein BN983_03619 [Halobacillus karajensis]CDQ28336.1 hypothetical protein BN981_02633 [Halobacillus karajensis]SEH67788.1 hypothetical protein SAMN05192559_10324 [Halobacillus karajensis]
MVKSKMFFISATLPIILMGCSLKEGTFIQGDITGINKESGEMEIEIEAWTTVGNAGSSTELYEFEKKPNAKTIRVSNPKKYEEGQKVEVKVIKNYEEDVWDINRLKFEVEKVN